MEKKLGYRILLLVLLLSLWGMATVFAAMVTVSGQGESESTALHAAMRQAIEQQVGVYIDSRTYVENFQLINDRIYTQTNGYIRSYEILNKSYLNGLWTVEIRADVSEEKLRADLMSQLQKKALIGANMMDPRVGVLAVNSNGGEDMQLENLLISRLQNEGFSRLIDLNQIDASVRMRLASADFEGDADLRNMLSTQFNVDYLVKATISKAGRNINNLIHIKDPNIPLETLPLSDIIPDLAGLNRSEVSVSVRMMNVNNGEIVYAGSGSGQGSGRMAESTAIQQATSNLMNELAHAAINKAANPEQHVTIIITDNALGSMSQAYQRISSLPGVSHVFTRSTSYGNIQVDVDYVGTSYDLAMEMERSGISIKEMTSEYIKI
ncbi:MAG: hypothetical protein IKH16_07365 [Selenomonadaceae bacterium]|nr:hypothetical protein [Selenomonadaceae bacterium]